MNGYVLNIFDFAVSLFTELVQFWQMIPVAFNTDFILWFNSTFEYVPSIVKEALALLFDVFGFSEMNVADVIISCLTSSFLLVVISRFVVLLKNLIKT